MNDKRNELSVIKNPYLLKGIFGYGRPENDVLKDCNGYLSAYDKFNLGKVFLEFCYSKMFNIHKLPGYEMDWHFKLNRNVYRDNLANASPELIEDACCELYRLYKHIQRYYAGKNINHITLKRMIQSFEREEYTKQLNNNKSYVDIPCNTITSYTDDKSPGGYYSNTMLLRKVKVSQIVMAWFLLADPLNNKKEYDDEHEFWIINPSATKTPCFSYGDTVAH